MTASGIADVLPLSPLQEGLFFQSLYHGDGPDLYVTQLVLELSGPLDRAALRRAVDALLARHPHLGAAFVLEHLDRPLQVVPREVTVPMREIDFVDETELARQLTADRDTRFDLSEPPLLRLLLARVGVERYELALTSHHILLDGWSLPVLVRELRFLYRTAGDASGLPPTTPYRAYLAWLADQDRDAARAAWRAELAGVDEPSLVRPDRLPERGPVPPQQVTAELDAERTRALLGVARDHGGTLGDVVQGAWAVMVGRLAGRDDVVFGTVTAGRPPELPGVEHMVGLFINTVPTRLRLRPDAPVWTVVTAVRDRRFDLNPHQHLPLAEIHAAAGLGELFDTVVVFENYSAEALDDEELHSLRVTGVRGVDATHYPLMLVAVPGERLRLRLDYQPDLIGHEEAEEILAGLRSVFAALVEEPDRQLGRLDPLSTRHHAWLTAGNDTDHAVATTTVPALVKARCRQHPDRVAVVFGKNALTYAEVNRRANRLARLLLERGAGPERLVALALIRSMDLVVALLAVLKTGAAYLPVDPEYPPERIAYMIGDARPLLVLTDTTEVPTAEAPAVNLRDIVLTGYSADDLSPTELAGPITPATAVSVIYTSGSTGLPKGVVGTHGGLVNRMAWFGSLRPFEDPDDALCAKSSISFIDGTVEVLQTLVHGGRVVLTDAATAKDMAALADRVAGSSSRVLTAVPSVLLALLDEVSEDGRLATLRLVCSSGEPMPTELPARLALACPDARLVNFCGCTEVSSESLFAFCDEQDQSTGEPLWNTRAYVLDGALRPVPSSVAGDLYYGGVGVGRGYLERPRLTAERFVADPFGSPGARMYRTGDRVRWRSDGKLVHLGRSDDQLKVRGVRIEAGEVEAVLARYPAVERAAVAVRDLPGRGRLLVGYVVGTGEAADLRRHSAAMLPAASVPSAFVFLDELPTTPNNKLDRRALPAPIATADTAPPANPAEQVLCDLFGEVLGLSSVGARDDFFSLGGHSLLATRLIARVHTTLGYRATVRMLFDAPTPAGLAARLGSESAPDALEVLLPLRAGTGWPLFCFHPAGGFSWCYAGLLRWLPADHPVYGLQARGLTGPEHIGAPVEDMVTDYVTRLRTVQDAGPYALLGWSLGGQLAHAVASRLRAEGDKVSLLAMLDAYPPEELPPDEPVDRDRVLRLLLTEYFGLEGDVEGPLDPTRVSALLRTAGVADLTEEHLAAVADILAASGPVARSYRPEPFDGDVLFFRAALGWPGAPPDPHAWRPYVGGRIEVHDVEESHGRMTQSKALAQIGRVLRTRLDP